MKIALIYRDALGGGGYPRDVRWLATALANHGLDVTLFCGSLEEERRNMDGLTDVVRIENIENIISANADVYHVFGIFIVSQVWQLYRLLRGATIVSPMGHLMPFHLRRKAVKKAIYLKIIKPVLKKVRWFHVFSSVEADSVYRYLGRDIQTFEAGLGVFPLPESIAINRRDRVHNDDSINLLFFGRNDVYQKGIDILLQGFAKAVKQGANVTLTIAGQPWGNSERFIRNFIEKERLGSWVRVIGPVEEIVKWKLLQKADYLVFLSRWDGPPRPIREAISVGTPVIVSPETNMGHLVSEFNAGIEVSLNAEKVAQAIIAVSQDPSKQAEHRAGVVKLRERLDWSRVAEDYIRGYEQVLARWR